METLTFPSPHAPPLPTLPFDLVADIFYRLPVKLLLQLRCLCKSFHSLISDSKFVKKHLQLSIKRPHLIVSSTNNLGELLLIDFPMSSVFSTSTVMQTQLSYPITGKSVEYGLPMCLSSCDGILCFAINANSVVLWNPSIRKFKLLPRLESPSEINTIFLYSFGYDRFIDNYKIISISFCVNDQIDVSVNTMGTNFWRRIHGFPYCNKICGSGVFASDTVNWLAYDASSTSLHAIVSLDLEKESYQKLSIPDLKKDNCTLGVIRDCLYIFECNDMFLDVWMMKEYGNNESWTKLYNVRCMKDQVFYSYTKALYISEDDQFLINFYDLRSKKLKLAIYDSKNCIWKNPGTHNVKSSSNVEVYIESLISPCS
ncbi:F-box/kelch-repeat protein At3g23880-like [Vicia villosa]|uniref:F-box/kelch-repeat protein At3g23880-like n=1 Tax=Vicia villosa TaxID=3911 RepID=UPI00273B3C47|nr:F-box/kelch-repeat protein At3g23880-like [Vicia villosa]